MSTREPTPAPFVCTKDNPWNPEKPTPVQHTDSVLEREEYDWSDAHEDFEVRRCPHCGTRFRVTIPT